MWKPFVSLIVTVIVAFAAGWFAHDTVGNLHFGPSQAEEGNVLKLGRRAFRFNGVESPPATTEAGVEARDYLQFVIADRFVWCRHTGDFSDGKYIGLCYAAFENLNRRMVAEGFARDCPSMSDGRYADLQERAREMKRGLWADDRMPSADPSCLVEAASEVVDDSAPAEETAADEDAAPPEEESPPADETSPLDELSPIDVPELPDMGDAPSPDADETSDAPPGEIDDPSTTEAPAEDE